MHRDGTRDGHRESSAMSAAGIKKGPWSAEEDAVLMDYVAKHGPREWSSIRSKGLLPRTGKSCRLRWVNKLKPGLKSGCKFSPEEERVVIDLQGKIGNKWARIAAYLSGRTDNDVKNFWSTRQKRLARLLRTPLPSRGKRNSGVVPIISPEFPKLEQNVNSSDLPQYPACLDIVPYSEQCPSSHCNHSPNVESLEVTKKVSISDQEQATPPPQAPFDHSLLDLPVIEESQDIICDFDDLTIFHDHFACPEICQTMQLPVAPTFFDDVGGHGIFDDFPADMFDSLEPPPSG